MTGEEKIRAAMADAARHEAGEDPDPRLLAEAPLVEDWRLVSTGESRFCLEGVVLDHPTLPPGLIRTSRIFTIAHDDSWARTLSRYYRLGRPLFSRGHA